MWNQRVVSTALIGLVVLVPLVTPRQQLQAPAFFRSVPTTVRARENATIALPCFVDSLGASTVRWWRGEALLAERTDLNTSPLQSPLIPRVTLRTDNSLEVTDLEGADAGDYICQVARLPPWSPIKQIHTIEVLFPPSVSLLPTEDLVTVQLGEEVSVLCEAFGVPSPVVSWTKMDGEWPDEENGQQVQRHARLKFIADNRHVAGVYQCVASNDVGNPASTAMRLVVQYPPEVEAEKPWIHTSPGLRAELACIVLSEPYPQVEWVRERESNVGAGSGDGEVEEEEVVQSGRVSRLVSGERHSLLLKSMRESELGNYTCRARNQLGFAETKIELSGLANSAVIKTDPTMATDNSYTLIWEVDSYSPIFEYVLKFKKQKSDTWMNLTIPAAGGARSTTLHSHAFSLRGLESGTNYEAQLSARNRFGWNIPSLVTVFSTLGPGETPSPEVIEEDGETEIIEQEIIATKNITPLDKKPASTSSNLNNAAVQYKISAQVTPIIICCLLYNYF